MFEKIKKFTDKFYNIEFLLLSTLKLTAIFLAISCLYITVKGQWKDFFYYSEADYSLLEEEANRIITEKDFTTEYELKITFYNNQTHSLNFELSDDTSNYVTVSIDNITDEDTEFSIERNHKSKKGYILTSILCMIVINMIFAFLVILIIMLLIILISLIIFIVKWIYKIIRKKHLN